MVAFCLLFLYDLWFMYISIFNRKESFQIVHKISLVLHYNTSSYGCLFVINNEYVRKLLEMSGNIKEKFNTLFCNTVI
jgi:hypothetical protein